ncbi:acVLRF1 family peptidyl-tRNA hydrolase [Sphaerisporangium sp. TRM90804]|uniref:acVLRF1 family peptidyl-tRNA hydrolase n=1 Tax=Sphaerisporangium sp. TRM90804 TaxID=3031113 RepID=UPI00244B57BA|nr:acVLRF1 family peptidyl-tRNA hydrolase [Sphaerisporangium sp. TRM90804]MDH2430213.1 acVLRF1 family peptidyl-tRNA hydrolase [Sphaerisporangium sp. TRM90804]
MASRPAAGGGRWVSVAPGRLEGWLRGFTERHGPARAALRDDFVRLEAEDGAVAECHVPFPPLRVPPSAVGTPPGGVTPGGEPPSVRESESGGEPSSGGQLPSVRENARGGELSSGGGDPGGEAELLSALVAHAVAERRVGVLLVRLGGHAAGVFEGDRLVASKVGSRLVHGRSAAGGWSQHRFARRREKQANEAVRAAADVAVRVLVPQLKALDAVVLGGDRRAMEALREDRRLAPVFALECAPFLDVPDPRLSILQDTPSRFRAVRVRLLDTPTP